MSHSPKDILINKAIVLLNEGQVKKSLKEALRAKKKFPDEPFIYNLLGVLYADIGSYEDSIKNYLKAIKLNPKYFEAYNNIGVAYTSWKKVDKSLIYFDRAIEINPLYAEAYNNKGNSLKENGDYALALEAYEKSVQLNPTYIEAITNLGIIWDVLNDFTKSERFFQQALSLNPNNTSILYSLANCFFNAKEFKKAIEICQKITDLDVSFYYAYNRIGLCYLNLENEEQAKNYFEKAIQIKPNYSEGLTNYGFVLQKLRNYSLATVQFEKALNIDRNSIEALVNLSKAYFEEGKLLKAIEVVEKGLSLKPQNIPLLKNLVVSLILLDRIDEALVACKKILAINNDDADAVNAMGSIYEKKGLLDDAKTCFVRAIDLDKNLVSAKTNLATIYQLEGHTEKASKIYNDLIKDNPENPEALYHKSALALQLENFKEGWGYYDNRWRVFPMNRAKWPSLRKEIWKGQTGKKVALWREQGIGDQIVFLSLVPEVKKMCSGLSVYVDPRLVSLCKRGMPEINFVRDVEELQDIGCDYHLPLGSVPGLIRNDISDFDRTVKGYLKADPERVKAIRDELNVNGKTVIGISWKSSNSLNQAKKSVQLRDMGQIFLGLDVVLVNLQYGDVENEIQEFTKETGIDVMQCASVDNREDLDGLAALIEVCDLVISTSNVTIHLAGALAKETWVLLPYIVVNFWVILERTDSIWYPSLKLYHQPTLNDWDSVYVSIRKALLNKL